ncbi:hypothetical protein PG988_012622 [Apiospora saccharicola]
MEPSRGDSDPDTATRGRMRSSSSSTSKHQGKQTKRSQISNATCPRTGASHTNLLEFDIHVCPRCKFHLIEEDTEEELDTDTHTHVLRLQSDSEVIKTGGSSIGADILAQIKSINESVGLLAKKAKHDWSGAEDEGSGAEEQQPCSTENLEAELKDRNRVMADPVDTADASSGTMHDDDGQKDSPSGIHHVIEFQDSLLNRLHKQSWETSFDLTESRKGVEAHGKTAIAEITTFLTTDIRGDDDRTEKERVRITKAGFLRNPAVGFVSLFQFMVIESKQVIAALRALVKYYPSESLERDPIEISSPFCLIAHYLKELEAYKGALSDKQQLGPAPEDSGENSDIQGVVTVDHLGQLLDVMKTNMFGRQIPAEYARHAQSPPSMHILYALAISIRDILRVPVTLERSYPYRVALWSLDFDGTYVRRVQNSVIIGSFDGERLITDLKVVPASFIDETDGGKSRRDLIQRGRKCYGMLTGAQQWHYSGQTLDKKTLDSRVVIDLGSYLQEMVGKHEELSTFESFKESFAVEDTGRDRPICQCETCHGIIPHPPKGFPWADYDLIRPETDDLQLPEGYPDRAHRYLLCSGHLKGFSLRTRTWESLDVDLCKPANINPKAIDTLVMPDERKRMIKAIVQKHTGPMPSPAMSVGRWGADFIQTKGEGQIFLLHGGPGVGKTYTMERSLSKWFKLAEQWGSVMLLDEADVWLERRMVSDLKRNTLVAVFLRCLEYYRGILFLTSNRVGTFDDAFISRIHVVIYYEDLGEPQRKQIWKQFFDKLERERKDSITVESRAKHFVLNDSEMRKMPWNGREIRNAFQTAVSLAEYRFYFEGGNEESDKIVLDKMDFEQVCQMSLEFKNT